MEGVISEHTEWIALLIGATLVFIGIHQIYLDIKTMFYEGNYSKTDAITASPDTVSPSQRPVVKAVNRFFYWIFSLIFIFLGAATLYFASYAILH